IFMAEIAYVGATLRNPLYAEEMNILEFLQQPDVTLLQALLLKFKPANMDVLPLYIVLLIGFPPVLWLLRRAPQLALAGSVLLYVLTWHFNWNLPAYPTGTWFFNPFAWQLLFVFGAWCAIAGAKTIERLVRSDFALSLAVAYLLFAFCVSLTWYFPSYGRFMPKWLSELIYPIDKTNLDVLRFMHFLALALLVVRLVPKTWPALKSPLAWPAIVCGQQSLAIFCLGVFLAFTSHFILVEVSDGIPMQVALSVLGIIIMVVVAAVLQWYKRVDGRRPGPRPPSVQQGAGLAGGEA
ncbi:MAG: OpgC domain-containing protein, partial [Rhizobiales bacterium]|nr:OpgC domain-containing protein [Hyphomicrobiales bacterium]